MRLTFFLLLGLICSCSTSHQLLKENLYSQEFSFSNVVKLAEAEAKKSYQAKKITVPDIIKNMTYNQYGAIRYNPEYELWAKERLPYRLSFFHLGMLYNNPVDIYEIDKNTVKPVPFSPDFFSCFSEDAIHINRAMPKDAGYAGLRLTYNLKRDNDLPDDAVFLGGSYFRIASGGCSYGISNRAVAVNTGLEGVVEEFPSFEKFWLKKPKNNDKEVVVFAYLNGPSITGAYSFKIRLGDNPEVDVKSVIFLRSNVKLLGLAPITSMFWFSSGVANSFNDYRPSVHNSDGLIASANNKTIWKPLVNYQNHNLINDDVYCESTPKFFGLIQRNREYNFYMDPYVKYHLNSNCWIIPQDNWGAGKIRLFIFPTQNEWTDNVNAFWIPDKLPEVGKPYEFNYKTVYSLREPETELTYVKYTNVGVDINDGHTAFVLSYADKDGKIEKNINSIKIDLDVPEKITISVPPKLERVQYNNTWRVKFNLSAEKLSASDKPYIIKVTLSVKDKPISETWYYQWYP